MPNTASDAMPTDTKLTIEERLRLAESQIAMLQSQINWLNQQAKPTRSFEIA